ncbi:hypothetical protein KQI84_13480 [bacterium]|nr:hypothetical protein [bacterium]
MSWIIAILAFGLFFHQVIESIVCSSGNRGRRKWISDLITSAVFLLALAVGWGLALARPEFRVQFGALVFFGTPFVLLAVGAFLLMSRRAYEEGDFDEMFSDSDEADGPQNHE